MIGCMPLFAKLSSAVRLTHSFSLVHTLATAHAPPARSLVLVSVNMSLRLTQLRDCATGYHRRDTQQRCGGLEESHDSTCQHSTSKYRNWCWSKEENPHLRSEANVGKSVPGHFIGGTRGGEGPRP